MPQLPSNIFQGFRTPGQFFSPDVIAGGKISKTFDEPTYLTFRLDFGSSNTSLDNTNYDKMPMPLFDLSKQDIIDARNYYSTIQFLRDSNEFVRAQMLEDFISKWNVLQNNYQWYFQSISGLDSILGIDPKRGMRVSKDGKITISMLEALDLRIFHLLNEYRKIAWDDVYQRWILPDMMRYFSMNIYVTEFRIFHQSNFTTSTVNNVTGSKTSDLILTAMDNLMPRYVIHCERCEFDITSFNAQINDLKVNEATMAELTFDIKIGNVTDEYVNPLLDYFWSDRTVNGQDRTMEFSVITNEMVPMQGPVGTVLIPSPQNEEYNPIELSQYGSSKFDINPDIDLGEKKSHISGAPFVQTGGAGASNITNSAYNTNLDNVDPIQPATWVGNALTFGKAFATNLVETGIHKASITPIPGLGFSFNQAIAALQSKDILQVFGLVRQSITASVIQTTPSQELDNKIIDDTFREFVKGIAQSEATNGDAIQLIAAANQVLNDRGQWEKIKDFSKATDLLSTVLGEINIGVPIQNPNVLKNDQIQQIGGEKSLATDGILQGNRLVFEGVPSSQATSGNITD
jgi:hypothetical protein